MAGKKKTTPDDEQPALLEWAAAALGLLLTLAALAVVLVEAFAERTPPDIDLRVLSIAPAGAGWRVEIEAENRGRATAADLRIEGEVAGETAETQIAYLPGRGTERATLGFREDPRGDELELAIRGWTEP